MPDLLLIPGFATDLRIPFLRRTRPVDGGFSAFRREVGQGRADVFRWGIAESVPLSRAFSLRPYLQLYQRERARADMPDVAERLWQKMEQMKPATVFCHSMGARVLLNAARRYGLPPSVKRIVFVQADMPMDEPKPKAFAACRVQNLFCPWDPLLAVSALAHHVWRAGQRGWDVEGVENLPFALLRPFNLHTASIRSPRLRHAFAKGQ